jgi:hypothetical protein
LIHKYKWDSFELWGNGHGKGLVENIFYKICLFNHFLERERERERERKREIETGGFLRVLRFRHQ